MSSPHRPPAIGFSFPLPHFIEVTMSNSVENWIPRQEQRAETPDLRGIGTGPKGYKERNEVMKRKIRERDEEVDDEGPTAMEEDPQDNHSLKRRKAEGAKYIPVRRGEVM